METPKWRRSPRESAWTQVNVRGSSPHSGLLIENHGAALLLLRCPRSSKAVSCPQVGAGQPLGSGHGWLRPSLVPFLLLRGCSHVDFECGLIEYPDYCAHVCV